MFGFTSEPGRNIERSVIEGFNSRLVEGIASFESSHTGVRPRLGHLV